MQKAFGGGDLPEGQNPGSFKGAMKSAGKKIVGSRIVSPVAKPVGTAMRTAANSRVINNPVTRPVGRAIKAVVNNPITRAPGKAISSFKKWASPPTAPQAPAGSNPAQAQGGTQTIVTPQTPTPSPLITNPSVVAKILKNPKNP